MKLALIIISVFIISISQCVAQQSPPAIVYAAKIAKRMKDTLSLGVGQQNQLYQINVQLQEEKQAAWQRLSGQSNLRAEIQKIEDKRDSLYKRVLPPPKYQVYLQKKATLLNNN